jgi:uncharacterized glyoxalase superfamily protein PhnB
MSTDPSTPFPLGVFVGNADADDSSAEATFDAENQSFDSLMGATPTFMNTYIDYTQAPSAWLSNAEWSASSAAASPTWKGEIPVIALPMGSTSSSAPSAEQILENYADGSYDSMLQGMVSAWAADGFTTQYWRPGVEMNLSSTPGFVGSSASMQALWISAFQHIYTVLHAAGTADGVNVKVIWNPGIVNDSASGNPTETLYPGNQYVDVIGADVYGDVSPFSLYDWDKSGQEINSPNPVYDTSLQQWASDPINLEHYYTDPAATANSLDASDGNALSLQDLINFAKAQGKPIAICETGAGNTSDGAGLSDNPTFVQWLSSTLESSGVTVDYVAIWDSNGGGTYAFANSGDDKPEEAAAWAKYFGAQSTATAAATTPITVTPATQAVSTDPVSVKPFTGVVITDANANQTETAIVTLSSAANGTLSDPNAATDGSTAATGVWSVSGSAAQVATDLDALVFTPSTSTSTVTTTVTAAIEDTAGEKASAVSTITATPAAPAHAASPADTQVSGTTGTIYDTSGNAWTITSGQQIAENGTAVASSANVTTLFWTGTALDQLNTSGNWWTQPLNGSVGTELSGAPSGYVAPTKAITITPATGTVAITDPASVKPFTGVAITDPNATQTETATVTLSSTANGALSDPNAATDGSKVTNGVLTVSGSSTAVASALDGLVFTPATSTSTVTTTVTAAIKDTAGKTASAVSTITATPATHAASPADTQVSGTTGTIYDTSGHAWTITSGQQIAENGTAVASSADVTTLFWTGTALDQLNTSGNWWTQPLSGSAGTELSGAPSGYVAPTKAITVTPATGKVATSDAASVKPFTGVAITDPNATQTETATVSLSSTANGALSDPNAATDGSKVTNGVLTVSGSSTAVGSALNGLVFTPTANQVAAGSAVTTTVTAAIKDTAGETASAASTVTATQAAAPAPSVDTLALQVSQDAWQGNAEFTVAVDGKQVGGDYTASALHSSGDAGTFLLTGDWGSGVNDVQVGFINDAYGGSAAEDRNLYVNSAAYNGVTYAGTTATLDGNSTASFAVGGSTPNASDPADTLTVNLSEDAWEGNAQFVLYIDGKAVSSPQDVTALHDANATQSFSFTGDLATGTHTLGVAFTNDAYGGSASEDRNLYINGVSLNGSSVFTGLKAQDGDGTSSFTFTTT